MNAVEFIIALKDQASSSIEKIGKEFGSAKKNADSLTESMGGMMSAFGVGFSLYQVVDMFKNSTEQAHKLVLAQTQVRASIESTRSAAGILYNDTLKQASKLNSTTLYSKSEITDMQSMLLTFPSVSKRTFEAAQSAILDMSTKMHQDVKMSTIEVGKALQDPKYGVMALRRVGVNLTREQAKIIQGLVETGHKDTAQNMILGELNNEFGGSAKKAFDATPLARYHKMIDEIQLKMGLLIEKVEDKLSPVLESMVSIATKVLHPIRIALGWIFKEMEHGNPIISGIVAGLGTFALIVGVVSAAIAIWTAIQWALNISLFANPIVWIIAGIAAFITIVVLAYQKVGWFRGAILATWEAIKGFGLLIKDFIVDRIKGILSGLGELGKALIQFFHKDWAGAWATAKKAGADLLGVDATNNAINNAKKLGNNIGKAYQKGVAEAAANNKGSKENKTIPGTNVAYGMNGAGDKTGVKQAATSVATGGSRNTSIIIHMGKMVESIIFQGGLKENAQDMTRQLEELLVRVLYAAESAG